MNKALDAVRVIAGAITTLFDWLADRLEDLAKWAANLVRFLPNRLWRLGSTLVFALLGIITVVPVGVRVLRRGGGRNFQAWLKSRLRQGGIRVVQLLLEILDVAGLPEIFSFIWRILTRATPLTGTEITAAANVLGPLALRYQDIRVAQRGILRLVFAANGGRAFTTFHTVNMPDLGGHQRTNLDILVHELVHVYQYERAGSRYFAEALLAQQEEGYGYGGAEGLGLARDQGKRLRDFNREQQAQIVQDYYTLARYDRDASVYEPFIEQLRQGKV